MKHLPQFSLSLLALALTACGGGGSTDTTKPTVALSGPASVTTAGTVTYTASASDASGIASVQFSRGSTVLGTDSTAPYEQAITFSAVDNGTQTITATATDTSGNAASASQNVTVNIAGGSGLITRLSGCTLVNTTSDPTASACLAGGYSGKTIDNKDCSLTVRADGSYDYASPTLTYTVTPAMISTRIFTYTKTLDTNQIIWLISGTSTPNVYELNFSAVWGSTAPSQKLEIKADIRFGVASTCLLPLQ